jgi:hypothetical protein
MRCICLTFLLAALVYRATAAFPAINALPLQTNLPNVMTLTDSSRVMTPELWPARRDEMKAILEHYELGHAPSPPGNVKGKIVHSQNILDGAAKYRLVHLSFGPRHKLGFDIAVFTPAGRGPFPTIINPSFFMLPGFTSTNPAVHSFPTPDAAALATPGYSNALARGYALVTWHYTECGEDNSNFLATSYYPAYPGYDWGELLGWSWGLSRVVDYVEKQTFADKTKLIALGHSRLGKMVFIASAFDDRISLAAPVGSGCGGTGAWRFCGPGRGGKEGIEGITKLAPWWFTPRFKEFAPQVYKLPFDEHWFVALTAPRPWISLEATHDQYCVSNAVEQTVLAAKPVYQFLGNPNGLGLHFENHKHALTEADWNDALNFADQQLRGLDHHRAFDQFPPEQNGSNNVILK